MTRYGKTHITNTKTGKTWCGRDTDSVFTTIHASGSDKCESCYRNEMRHWDRVAAMLKSA